MPLPVDDTTWSSWWRLNQDPFLDLASASRNDGQASSADEFFLGTGRMDEQSEAYAMFGTSRSEVRNRVVPALLAQLRRSEDAAVDSACLIALGRSARQFDSEELHQVFVDHLGASSQRVRESAALALGLCQESDGIVVLSHLVADDPVGRQLVSRDAPVSYRTRSLAAYGLGLIAPGVDDVRKQSILAILEPVLHEAGSADRNLRVAAVQAIGMLRPDLSSVRGRKLCFDAARALAGLWDHPQRDAETFARAHVPLAVAKLMQDLDPRKDSLLRGLHTQFRRQFLDVVRSDGRGESNETVQSAALAIGLMASSIDVDPAHVLRTDLPGDGELDRLDAETARTLRRHVRDGSDRPSRYFGLLAMARQGGLTNRDALIRRFRRSPNRIEQGWAAISLGVLAAEALERDPDADVRLIGEVLESGLDEKNDSLLGAIAVALGLAQHQDAERALLRLLDDKHSVDELASHLCTGLSLLGSRRSIEPMRRLVADSERREERLQSAAVALGKLGDEGICDQLLGILGETGRPTQARLRAVSGALTLIGDQDSIGPLVSVLDDERTTAMARVFAASALGGIADGRCEPWHAAIGRDINYRAAVETLTGPAGVGVLDFD